MSRARSVFHGWRVVGAGAVLQALTAGLFVQGYGLYAVKLEEAFDWSKTLLSAAYGVSRGQSAIVAPVQGWALDRFGTKPVVRAGVVLTALSFLGFSRVQNAWQFFIIVLILAIGASLCGFLTVTTAIVRWFERRRAFALAIASMGFAVGGASAPAVVWLLNAYGWRTTAVISAVVVLLAGWPMASILDGAPADRGEFVDGIDPATIVDEPRAEGVGNVHFTARQALRTRAFWMISLGHASALLVVGAVIAHLSLYLTEEQGFSLQKASYVVGALPIFQILGMLGGGRLGDRVNKRLIASCAMVGHMCGLLLLTFATSEWMIWAFVPLHGLAWGFRGPLMQAIRADYFGSTAFGKIMGLSAMIIVLGSVGGPLIAGVLADVTDSYRLGFTIIALVAGAGLTFFVLATPPDPPEPEDLEPPWPARRAGTPAPSA